MTDEQTQMNSTEARTETGEIKDQSSQQATDQTQSTQANDQTTNTETKTTEQAGAPEKYEFTPPEGTTYNPAALEAATPIFKELGLNQSQAQKLVDTYSKLMETQSKSTLDAAENMRKEWRDAVAADKEIGSKTKEVQASVSKAIDQLGPDVAKSFREALDFTGAGDHPAVVKAMYEFSKLINEGSHVAGAGPSKHGQTAPGTAARPSAAQAMYPSLAGPH